MNSPRISANKLGEYMIASVARRRTIIRDQKHPPTIKVARYQQAKEAAEQYFLSGGKDSKAVEAAIVRLRAKTVGSDWALEDAQSTAQALDMLLSMRDQLFAEGMTYVRAPAQPARLVIAGVGISVQPHMLLLDEKRGKMGAVRLHYTKTTESALNGEGGDYVATLLHQWANKHGMRPGFVAAPQLSRCIDVFRKAVVKGPSAQSRRMDHITAACEEIAARWSTIGDK